MKRLLVAFTMFAVIGFTANAQDYGTGIGFRVGSSNGLTIKHFIGSETALEGLILSRWNGFNITGLYEIHNEAFSTPGLNWFYGFGGHIGFWHGSPNHPWFDNDTNSHSVIGVDGIVGIEYNLSNIPFNISLDWKPGFNIIGYTGFWSDELAFSVRFIF